MADPFESLRTPITPTPPAAAFADRLRARLARALELPRGVAVSTATAATAATPANTAEAPGTLGAAIPYLAVRDAARALDWYAEVFGARLRGEPIVMPDGRIGHSELELAGGLLYLAEEHPEIGVTAPRAGQAAVSLMLAVADADATRTRAIEGGATGDREPYDGYGQRNAWVIDPFGHRWGLHSPLAASAEPAATEASYRQGDVGYVWMSVPDVERAEAFYGPVLGWQFAPGAGPQARRVVGSTAEMGLWGGAPRGTLNCCYAVDDITAAVARVRAAGGQADEPTRQPYGQLANCVDDQGTVFALFEAPAGVPAGSAGSRPAPNGERQGDLAYLTLEVVDSARARAFYGEVLGWRFSGGHSNDGWQVDDVVPMTGMSGSHPQATGVPMWRVEDIATAVERVRAAGGTATDPARRPYGLESDCSDDQGIHFYLGQL